MPRRRPALLALHDQNENCHPQGKIRVGIAADAPRREERMANIGWPCTVVADACSTATDERHANARAAMRLLAEVVGVDEALAGLRDGATP